MIKKTNSGGFTIIELLMSIAIIIIVSTVVMFQYRDYTINVDLKTQAADIAVILREAQVNATSGKEVVAGSNNFKENYTVRFDTAAKTYTIFSDLNNNGTPDLTNSVTTNENPVTHSLKGGYELCIDNTDDEECDSSITPFSVTYKYGSYNVTVDNPATSIVETLAEIVVKKPGSTRKEIVRIWSTGRIEN
jgi:type II secretory pathway pseudopilin PulG